MPTREELLKRKALLERKIELESIISGQSLNQEQSQEPDGILQQISNLFEMGAIPGVPKGINPVAIGEGVAAIGSGAIGSIAGGLAGGLTALNPFTDTSGADVVESVQGALTFEPRTSQAQQGLTSLGKGLTKATNFPASGIGGLLTLAQGGGIDEAVGNIQDIQKRGVGKVAGEKALEVTDSPLVATAIELIPAVLAEGLGFKGIGKVRGKRRLKGISDDIAGVLEKNNLKIDNLSDLDIKNIKQALNDDFTSQMERQKLFNEQGLDPTKAELTQRLDVFGDQADLLKTSGKLSSKLSSDARKIRANIDDFKKGFSLEGARTVRDAVNHKFNILDDRSTNLYKQAAELSTNRPIPIKIDNYVKEVLGSIGSDQLSKGVGSTIKSDLVKKGIINNEGQVLRAITIDESESLRQVVNSTFDSTSPFGKRLGRELKETLLVDTMRDFGGDLFKKARESRADLETELNRAKIGKRDARRTGLVKDLLEGKIESDDINFDVLTKKKYTAKDLKELETYLTSNTSRISGQKAFNKLKSDALDFLSDNIISRGKEGFESVSRSKFDAALGRIGKEKMKALFAPDELKVITDIRNVAALKEAPPSTITPSGRAINARKGMVRLFTKHWDRLDFLKDIFGAKNVDSLISGTPELLKLTESPFRLGTKIKENRSLGVSTATVIDEIINRQEGNQ